MSMRILLAEDDPRVSRAIADSLTGNGVDVVTAKDGEETVRLLRSVLPDVLLLDMVMPRLDGLAVLAILPRLCLERQPRVIALSPFRQQRLDLRARQMGASEILRKPVELNGLLRTLAEPSCQEPCSHQMHRLISRRLSEAGISLHTKGGLFLMEAIAMAVRDYSLVEKMGEGLYQPIAKKHDTKPENVERLVRHAIERACTQGKLETLHRLFGYTLRRDTGKPTNAEFIAILSENIRFGMHSKA